MKAALVLILALTATCNAAFYSTKFELRNDRIFNELRDFAGVPLTSGTPALGDGAMLQFGYYSLADHFDPFAGEWVPLTGEGSRNGWVSTVGDYWSTRSAPDGFFMIGGWFGSDHELHGFDLPKEGTPMALRFYDGRSIATSTHYNALTDGTVESYWTMANPGGNHVSIVVGGGQWEGGPESEFRTTIPLVPEPSVASLIAISVLPFGLRGMPRKRS
jgi:hypothetical protein